MSIPTNWRNQHRERELVGYSNPETGEVSLDGVHWVAVAEIKNRAEAREQAEEKQAEEKIESAA